MEQLIASIDNRPPWQIGDVQPGAAMLVLVSDARRLRRRYEERFRALGWSTEDLFGCDELKPFARLDRQGLCWQLHDRPLVELHPDFVVIESGNGDRLRFRRPSISAPISTRAG